MSAQQAIDWFVRRQTGPASPEARDDFRAWLEASPDNAKAYSLVERVWGAAAEAEDHPTVAARRVALTKAPTRRQITRRAWAAALVAGLVAATAGGVYRFTAPKPLATQSFRTAVGQQATVSLPDGSQVTLNTDTIVRTRADKTRRLVYLERGQAFFKVAKDRHHPFVVTAAGRTVTALGTAFDVRVDQGALKVVLVEGKVRVESLAPPPLQGPGPAREKPAAELAFAPPSAVQATEMTAGSQLIAVDTADWRVTRADVAREMSWLHGQIVFDDEALGEIVDELNRYSDRKIVITDPALAHARLSGIFKPGDLHGFSRALKSYGMAKVVEESEGEVRIVALK